MNESRLLWTPSDDFISNSHLSRYINWLRSNEVLTLDSNNNYDLYDEVWKWSTENYQEFWLSLFDYFELIYDGKIERVVDTEKMPGVNWFEGVNLSYSEHVFRHENEHKSGNHFW